MSVSCQLRTRADNAIRFHFGDEATTNSAVSETPQAFPRYLLPVLEKIGERESR
jgi:hypothetical protein